MTGPHLRRPRPPLHRHIDFFGYWAHDGATDISRALPRGAATVVIDVGGRDRMDFHTADGVTLASAAPAFITGPGTRSYLARMEPGQTVLTIHFHPGGALPFVGIPLHELENTCAGLADIWGNAGTILRERLVAAPTAAQRIDLLGTFLLTRLEPRGGVLTPVLAAAERRPSLRVSEAAVLTGLTPKRLIATFRSEIGLTPKTYLRVRRLQSSLRLLDADIADGADIAAGLGYFDQSHFVREFREFTGLTPTQYAQRRTALPSHIGLTA